MGRQSTGKVHTPPFSINPRWHCFHRGGPFSSSLVIGLQMRKLHGGGGAESAPPAVLDSKKPGLFRVK